MPAGQAPSPPTSDPSSTPPPTPPKRRRRRRWLWSLMTLLALVVALVMLAPWLASTSPIRSLVVAQLNRQLNGSVTIESYSVGWFGGIDARNIRVYDARRALVLEIDEIRSPLSLLGALGGRIDFGDTVIGLNLTQLKLDADGMPNYLALLPASEPATPGPKTKTVQPATVPNLRGKLTLNIRGGTIEAPQLRQAVHLDPSQLLLTLPGGDDPIAFAARLGWRSGEAPPASVESSGSIRALRDGKLDLEGLSAEMSASLRNVDLGVLSPLVENALGKGNQLRGSVNGSFSAKLSLPANVSADGAIILDAPAFGGTILNGDVVSSDRLTLTAKLARDEATGTPALRIDELSVRADEGTVLLTGRVAESALVNLAQGRMPGADGQVTVQIDAPSLARPISQLRNSLKLAEGVQVSDAMYRQALHVRLFADRIETTQSLSAGASGTRDGKGIRLSPVTVESSATLHSLGPELPDVRQVGIKLAAADGGLGIDAQGPNLSGLNAIGWIDLDRLVHEASQFVDLGEVRVRGRAAFSLGTQGDPTSPRTPLDINASLELRDLRVEGLADLPPIVQPSTTATLSTRLLTPAEHATLPTSIEQARLALQSFDERGQPIIDLLAEAGGIDPSSLDVASFELTRLAVPDLAAAQKQLDPFVPTLREAGLRIERGSLTADIAGRFDGKTRTLKLSRPLEVLATQLSATMNNRPLLDGQTLSATLALDDAVADVNRPSVSGLRARFSLGKPDATALVEGKLSVASVDVAGGSVRGLVVENLSVSSLPDVQRRLEVVVPELASGGLKLTDGQLYVALDGSYDGATRSLVLDRPFELSVPNLSAVHVSESGVRRALLTREKLTARVLGELKLPEGGIVANLKELRVGSASGLFDVGTKDGQPVQLRFDRAAGPGGSGVIVATADLRRLAEIVQSLGGQVVVRNQPGEIRSGKLDATITFAEQPQASVAVTGAIRSLAVTSLGEPLEDQTVEFDLVASSQRHLADASSLNLSGGVRSPLLGARLDDALVVLSSRRDGKTVSSGTWDLLQRGRFELTVPDLSKLQAIADAFVPAAEGRIPDVGRDTVATASRQAGEALQTNEPSQSSEPRQPSEPLKVSSGSLSLRGALSRDQATRITRVDVPELRIESLSLQRGRQQYRFDPAKPLTFKLVAEINAAEINAADAPEPGLLQQVRSIRLTELAGDLQVCTLSMPAPLTISDLASDVPSAKGSIALSGDLDRAAQLLAVVSGGEPLPYGGTFTAQQQLSGDAGTITLVGNIDIDQLKVRDAADRLRVLHTEPKIVVRNDLALLAKPMDVELRDVSLALPTSNALSVNARGAVRAINNERRFDGLAIDLAYDLEKLWPIIKPMLPASAQKDIERSAMAGRHQTRIPITGSFPATDPRSGAPLAFHESIRFVEASGLIAVQLADLFGLRVEGLEVPFVLTDGQVRLIYPGKTGADRLPKPASVNGGTLDLAGIVVDLAQPDPRLSIGRNQRLLRQVSINPVLGDTLGKYINPVFPNSKQAKGLLDVTVQFADGVALGEAMKGKDSGRARVVFSLSEMDIANPLGSLLIGGLVQGLGAGANFAGAQADTFRGQIKDAVITLDAGRTTQDITLTLVDADRRDARGNPLVMPLRFNGDITLENLSQRLSVNLPTGLLTKFIRSNQLERNLSIAFPNGIPLTMTGTTLQPRVDFSGVMQQFLEGQLRGRLIPGGGGSGNPLQDLLRGLERDKDRKAPEPKPDR